MQNTCQLITNWVPGWRPFHNNLVPFSSQVDLNWQPTAELCHSPTSYFTSLHSTEFWQLAAARLVSSLYNLGADTTENTSNNPSVVLMGGCLAIYWISFPRERVYQPLLRIGCLFIRLLHRNGCTLFPFRGLCPAAGLYTTIRTLYKWSHIIIHMMFF
jgi:hypothetical protein